MRYLGDTTAIRLYKDIVILRQVVHMAFGVTMRIQAGQVAEYMAAPPLALLALLASKAQLEMGTGAISLIVHQADQLSTRTIRQATMLLRRNLQTEMAAISQDRPTVYAGLIRLAAVRQVAFLQGQDQRLGARDILPVGGGFRAFRRPVMGAGLKPPLALMMRF